MIGAALARACERPRRLNPVSPENGRLVPFAQDGSGSQRGSAPARARPLS
jgi:hypothetical protein